MMSRDIVVVGASAGGVAALKDLVKGLPKDFKGSVFVVLHIPPYTETQLPNILTKAGHLPAVLARDGEDIEPGKIYIAPNDHHLILLNNKIAVKRGPKENRFRPSIDALFRSAAYVYGTRVIGIILSGTLHDGASGLWTVKRHGGLSIIQQPEDAIHPQLPENVLEYVEPDFKLPAGEMGQLIAGMVTTRERFKFSDEELKRLSMEVVIASNEKSSFEMGIMNLGELTPFTCPECHGTLMRLVEDNIIRFRCHTGHGYTASSLLAEVSESAEEMLWQSVRAVEEMIMLENSIADHLEAINNKEAAQVFRLDAQSSLQRAAIINECIFKQEEFSKVSGSKQKDTAA